MTHPAARIPFPELIRGLENEVQLGYVSKKVCGHLTLYNYNQKCTFDQHWNRYTLVARGLIVSATKIEAYSFPKFFNYGELSALPEEVKVDVSTLSLEGAIISEKFDGSLGIIFFDGFKWRVTTRGSFESEQAKFAERYIRHNLRLGPEVIYLVEIIYPDNRIVIPYTEEKLVLLGAYDIHGYEILDLMGLETGWEVAPQYQFDSLDQLQKVCKSLSGDKEGFVVRFKDGTRIKLKGDRYCELHKHLSGCTPQRIWDALRKCENLKASLPEEFYAEYDQIADNFLQKYEAQIQRIQGVVQQYSGVSNKDIAQSNNPDKHFIFAARRPNFAQELYVLSRIRSAFFELFRPVNIL